MAATPPPPYTEPQAGTVLRRPAIPINVIGPPVSKSERNLTIACYDALFHHAAVLDEQGQTIYEVAAKQWGTSWSLRRSLSDASGNHILSIRHHHSRIHEWIIESPDGEKLCIINDSKSPAKVTTNATAKVESGGQTFTVGIRGLDQSGIRTVFEVDGGEFAEMILTAKNDQKPEAFKQTGKHFSDWKLRVAEGVDLAFLLALAFTRAEILHTSHR